MANFDWRPLARIGQSALIEARRQAHYAAQWLARAARAYVPARPDDGHTNLGWDATQSRFVTHDLPDGSRLGLRIPDLTLTLEAAVGSAIAFSLDGRTDADVRAWLGAQASARGWDAGALDAMPPYALEGHPIATGGAYAVASRRDALGELAVWFGNADASLGRIRARFAPRFLTASAQRCWPHHFDLATLMTLEGGDPEHVRSVNAGFSPGDEHYHEPYFYVSPWPYPEPARLLALPPIGHWHTQGFTAAIVLARGIAVASNPQVATERFVGEAIEAAVTALNASP